MFCRGNCALEKRGGSRAENSAPVLPGVPTGGESKPAARGEQDDGSAAVYGMASSMPAGPVKQLLYAYTDVKFKV